MHILWQKHRAIRSPWLVMPWMPLLIHLLQGLIIDGIRGISLSVGASLVIRFGVWALHLRVVSFLLICVHRFDHISE